MDELMKQIDDIVTRYHMTRSDAIEVVKLAKLEKLSENISDLTEHLSEVSEHLGDLSGCVVHGEYAAGFAVCGDITTRDL